MVREIVFIIIIALPILTIAGSDCSCGVAKLSREMAREAGVVPLPAECRGDMGKPERHKRCWPDGTLKPMSMHSCPWVKDGLRCRIFCQGR